MELSQKILDLISKLPGELQPVAKAAVNALTSMTSEQVEMWIAKFAEGNTDDAYGELIRQMPTSVLVNELDFVNVGLEALNNKSKEYVEARKQFILEFCRIVAQMLLGVLTI